MDPPTGISTRLAGFGVRLDSAPAGLPSRAIALDILGSTSGERGNYARSLKMSIGAEKNKKAAYTFSARGRVSKEPSRDCNLRSVDTYLSQKMVAAHVDQGEEIAGGLFRSGWRCLQSLPVRSRREDENSP
jgi:hypothetical protein